MAEKLQVVRSRDVEQSNAVVPYQSVQASPEAFGSSIGKALANLGGTVSEVAAIETRLNDQKAANGLILQKASRDNSTRDFLFHPQHGEIAKKGISAEGAIERTDDFLKGLYERDIASITDPKLRMTADRMWASEQDQIKDQIYKHSLTQAGVVKEQAQDGALKSAVANVSANPYDQQVIRNAIGSARQALLVNSQGLPPEQLKDRDSQITSTIHMAAAHRIAQDNPEKALQYYEANKKEFYSKHHQEINDIVKPAITQRKAVTWVDQRMGISSQAQTMAPHIAMIESSGNAAVGTNSKGASGLMQVTEAAAYDAAEALGRADIMGMTPAQRTAHLADPKNAADNKLLGTKFLDMKIKQFGGDIEAALIAYNAPLKYATDFQRNGRDKSKLPQETQDYLQKYYKLAGRSERTDVNAGNPRGTPGELRMTQENWTVKNFRPEQFWSKDGDPGSRWVDAAAVTGLDSATDSFKRLTGKSIEIISGTRSKSHNENVGGAESSQHLGGTAFDISVAGMSDSEKGTLLTELRKQGFNGVGFYGDGHIHVDMRNREAVWGNKPAWATGALSQSAGIAGSDRILPAGFTRGSVGITQPPAVGDVKPSPGFQMPDFKSMREEIWAEPDAALRSRMESYLSIQEAKFTTQEKERTEAIKNAAWNHVLQDSVSTLPPQILSQLEPSFVSSLYSFEEKRNKTPGIETDWQVWTDIHRRTDVELKNLNPNDYRNKLSDKHMDQLLDMHRAARGDKNADATSTAMMRTRVQVVDDVATRMGYLSGTGETRFKATINEKLDPRVELFKAEKGRPPNSLELQDMVDKLALADRATGFLGRFSARSAEATDPNKVVVAEKNEDIQADDRVRLQRQYQSVFGKLPDKETEVDLYNRAMRVWLGGKPDGPPAERSERRKKLEDKVGGRVSDATFEAFYGEWLLKFL